MCVCVRARARAMFLNLHGFFSVADGEADGEEEVRVAVRFIQHMHENGFSKQLAAKALKHVTDPNDLDEGNNSSGAKYLPASYLPSQRFRLENNEITTWCFTSCLCRRASGSVTFFE